MAAIARGEIVIVVDAEDRENEGDFVCAAEKVTPEAVNFMITHGRGQLCMPILPEVSERLKLAPMVEANTSFLGTSYTVPVDHKSCKTGITAQERALTDPLDRRSGQQARRLRASRPPVSAGGQRRRRAPPRRAYRSHGRPDAHGRLVARPASSAKFSAPTATAPRASSCSSWPTSTSWKSSPSKS